MQRKRSKQKAASSRRDLDDESSEEDEKDEVVEYLDDDDDDEDEDIGAMRYADFFDVPDTFKDKASKKAAKTTKSQKATDDDSKEKSATKHEMKQEKVKKRIQELEEAALGQKSWELKGEVAGKKRPENSLLEIDAEWDTLRAAAPDVAPERTLSLEDMIKQRVLDERWDSVIPRRSVQASVTEMPELSQEKSALGLGEVYEKDFLHRTLGVTVDEHAATRDEARALYAKVCRKLDALSNFSFTPRAAVPDMKVTPSVGAIAMEEVLPMGVSQADARAPSDVHAKKRGRDGLVRSNEETSKEERKRARGAKKTARRKERRADEAEAKLVSRINPGLGNPYEKRKLVEVHVVLLRPKMADEFTLSIFVHYSLRIMSHQF
jgi:U3 small nucleolar RNA-associated protein MPP10